MDKYRIVISYLKKNGDTSKKVLVCASDEKFIETDKRLTKLVVDWCKRHHINFAKVNYFKNDSLDPCYSSLIDWVK